MLTSTRTTNLLLLAVLVVGIAIVTMLATGVRGGPLDPPGPVNSTMRQLDELLPSWSKQLTSAGADPCNTPRFICVFPNGAAVLDHETGLVWQRTPVPTLFTWSNAVDQCATMLLGGRYGWRMPSVDELASLLLADTSGPFPAGISGFFWTTSRFGGTADLRRVVGFFDTPAFFGLQTSELEKVWCVRGGANHDPQ